MTAPYPCRVPRPSAATYVLLALLLVLAGCSSGDGEKTNPSPSASVSTATAAQCAQVSASLLGSVQAYVDSYAPALAKGKKKSSKASPTASPSPAPGEDIDLQASLRQAQADLKKGNCSAKRFRAQFTRGLDKVKARGPLAQAILLRLTASLTGTLASAPQEVRIGPKDDLPQTLARLASGSTVRLKPGRYRLKRSLVVLAGVTVEGAGAGRTTVSSSAAGSALLLLTDEVVQMRRLAVRHAGPAPASVVVTSPGSRLSLTGVTITGGRGAPGAPSAGSGVSMTAGRAVGKRTSTSLEVTGGSFTGNFSAGLLLTGQHRASIRRATFTGNGQCGICFGGATSGAVRGSTFTDNTVGVAVFGKARPILEGDRFSGGQVGIQASENSAPAVLDARIDGTSRAAMIFTGASRGRVNGSTCTASPYGIVVGKKALPYLGKNECHVAAGG